MGLMGVPQLLFLIFIIKIFEKLRVQLDNDWTCQQNWIFYRCSKPFSSNKVVSKIVPTGIVFSSRQLVILIKTYNQNK